MDYGQLIADFDLCSFQFYERPQKAFSSLEVITNDQIHRR